MRILAGIFAALLILFAAVQWNDPDGPMWMVIYGIGAIWCAIAAFRPGLYRAAPAFGLLCLTFVAAVAGMVYFWPKITNWWDIDVWWPEVTGEPAREGMGMMVLVILLLAPLFVALRARRG